MRLLLICLGVVLWGVNSIAQKECHLKDTEKLVRFSPKKDKYNYLEDSEVSEYKYRCMCKNGNMILGNFDENGVATGRWKVEMTNKKYKVVATGEMVNGRVSGDWSDSNWCHYHFERGKLISRICAK